MWLPKRKRGGGYSPRGGGEPTFLHVAQWMCKRLGSTMATTAATFPYTKETPPPPARCLHPEIPAPHHLHAPVGVATLPLEAMAQQGPKSLLVAPGGWRLRHMGP